MLQIKKIELIALAILLLAGITGGQVWGSKNINELLKKMAWINERERITENAKKKTLEARKYYDHVINRIEQDTKINNKKLIWQIERHEEHLQKMTVDKTKNTDPVAAKGYEYSIKQDLTFIENGKKELEESPKKLENTKTLLKEKCDKEIEDINKSLNEKIKGLGTIEEVSEDEQKRYKEWKEKKDKELSEKTAEEIMGYKQIKEKVVEEKVVAEQEVVEQEVVEEKEEVEENDIAEQNLKKIKEQINETAKENSVKEQKIKELEEEIKEAKVPLKAYDDLYTQQYITLICGFIGGIISSFKFGTGLANENKNGLLEVVKNNWQPFGFGTAFTCGTTAYSYKKCGKKVDPSPIIIAGLVGHTLGMATGLVTGYGVKKFKNFSCYR